MHSTRETLHVCTGLTGVFFSAATDSFFPESSTRALPWAFVGALMERKRKSEERGTESDATSVSDTVRE